MSALRSFRSGRLRSVRRIAVITVLIAAGLMWISAAQAVHNNGMFELEGNTTHDSATTPPYDWNSLFDASGNKVITPDPINGPLLADAFVADTTEPDQSYFTSNKDIQPIASGQQHWGCSPINNPLDKDNLLNAYAAVVQVPANATNNAGHQVLYLASERGSNNGTSFAGFWLLKDKNVGCSGQNDFSGHHTDGDLLIISDYTNGGGTQDVSVYRWTGDDATGQPVLDSSFNGSLCTAAPSNDNACAIANNNTITTPWAPTSHDSNTFVEAGIDLTTLLGSSGGCFTNFLAETRSSNQLTATLKDFASGQFNTCVPPIMATTAAPGGSSNPLGVSNQHDVATISPVAGRPNPTGTISFFLCNPSQVTAGGCVSGGTQVGSAVTIASGSATSANASGSLTNTVGKYCWRAEYTPDTDASNFYVSASHTNATGECFTVIKASPTIVTNASTTGGGVVGTGTTCDSATLSGSFNGTGTITFTLTAPDNTTSQVGSAVTVSGNGTYQSPSCPLLTQVGTYTWHASYSGDSLNNGAVDNGANESVTSVKASPTIVTNASTTGGGVVGTGTTCDSATLSGSYNGTGTITFTLTAPDTTTTQIGSPVTVNGNGSYDSPSCPLLTEVGTYTWHASYSGDDLNNGAVDNGANESVTSVKASPTIVTNASTTGGGVVGTGTTCDSATLSGSYNGTGTITFSLTTPDDTTSVVGSVPVSGDDTYDSPSCPLLTQVGTYTWSASYSGDGLNNGAVDNGENETVTSIPTTPSITTETDPASGSVGDTFKDKATLSGTFQQDGTDSIVWTLYPNDNCTGTPLGTDSVSVDDNGTFETPNGVTVNSAGTYYWVAQFLPGEGDPNNGSATSGCADEPITVKGAAIHILKTADHTQVSAGDPIGFTMTVWNDGDGVAKGVTLTDQLPTNPGLTWVIAGQGTGWSSPCSIAQGVLKCGPDTVPAGTTKANSTFTVHITSVTDKTTAGDCGKPGGLVSNTGDVTTTNDGTDNSTATVCVAAPAIHIVKTADKAQVNVGDPIGFTMTVWNDGPGNAHGVVLNDVLPSNPGLAWTIASQGAGWAGSCHIAAGVLSCGPVTVPTGTTQAASTFTVHITSGTTGATGGDCPETGVVDNTGTVTTSNDGTDDSSASTCVQALVDLAITKSGSPARQTGLGNITWTMVVTNNGPSTATGVTVSDPMPAGNTYVSSQTTQGTCTGGAILNCDIGTMAAGATVTITLVTTPSTYGTQTNTAVVQGDRPETNVDNNTATASVVTVGKVTPPCVAITKITPGQLIVGRKTLVTIHLARKGFSVKGIKVRIKGAGINVKTKGANSKGIIKHTLKMKRKGILVFTPIASSCGTKRIGVRGVFTPPVTG